MMRDTDKTQRPTRRQRLLLVAFGLIVALLLLLAIEGILRIAGVARPDPFFLKGPYVEGHGTLHYTSREWARRFFFQKVDGRLLPVGSSVPQFFFAPKPQRALRVAIVGESTVQGFPHPENLSISKYVEQMLRDIVPDREVQVFNFGFTAVASYPVSRIVEEILEPTQCDAIVLLVGHNEFFGAYGVASSQYAGDRRSLLALHEWYNSLRFVSVLREGFARIATPAAESGDTGAPGGLIRYMAAEDAIGPDDPRRARAAALLEANVRWALRAGRRHGTPMLVSTMPSNLSGLAPVGRSTGADPATDAALAAALGIEDDAQRLAALESLVARDPLHALLWFRLGEAREQAGDLNAARTAYERALDLDGMPWRTPTAGNDALRRAAQAERAILIDSVALFQQHTDKAAPGWDFFDDHVHPSVRGRVLYARGIVGALLPVLGLEDRADALRDDAEYQRRLGGDNLLSIRFAFGRARSIFQGPPMRTNNDRVYERFTRLMADMDAQMTPEEAIAWKTYQELITANMPYPPLGLMAGTMQMHEGKLGPAIYQLGIARHARPIFSMSFVQAAWTEGHCRRIAGIPLGEPLERDLELALLALDVLPQIDTGPEFPLHKARGQILWVQERFDEALVVFDRALATATTDDERAEIRAAIDAIRQQVALVGQSTRLNIE